MSAEQGYASGGADVPYSLPADQNPAMSEDAFLGLQKQRPLGSKKDKARPRPSDITVTEPTYLNYRDQLSQDTAPGSSRQAAMTPQRSSSPFASAASPSYRRASASPRHLSPATSQIFERDVQESTLAPELSPAIPSHIQTEDHIPSVLDASSEVITNSHLNPDEVEVVTHTQHQPAAMTVAGSSMGDAPAPAFGSEMQLGVPISDTGEDGGSTYGTVDPTDPRRLSFISFADVVHGEHVETGKEPSSHLMSPDSIGTAHHPRSPSPVRSAFGDRGTMPPPTSSSGSGKGTEVSPSRGPGSISPGQSGQHGDITIQTMRETLEQSGSHDIGQSATSA